MFCFSTCLVFMLPVGLQLARNAKKQSCSCRLGCPTEGSRGAIGRCGVAELEEQLQMSEAAVQELLSEFEGIDLHAS